MSQWKQLARLNADSEKAYSRKSQKYTPRKLARDEQSPSRFHNQTIDKINNSNMSEDKEHPLGRSFVGRAEEAQNQVKKMKTSSSQVRLNKDSLVRADAKDMKETHLSYGAQGLARPERISLQVRKPSQFAAKPEKSLLYEQIQKIKKEFTIFQSIILKQLQRQERLINSMFEDIITKMNEESENARRNYQLMANTTPRMERVDSSQTGKYLKKYSIQSGQREGSVLGKIERPQFQDLVLNQSRERNAHSFERFFQAMQNLKKNISELNFMSDVSSVASPKSAARKQFNFENITIK